MITSVFKKSTPFNFSLVVILMLVFFFLYQIQDVSWAKSIISILQRTGLLLVLLATIFLDSFISKRNGLSRDSTYTAFFYFLFLLFFPKILNNSNLILSNFFVLLAIRRLVSLQSLKETKEKLFDASLWIFVAALFQFWSILYILLVFISVIFHVSRDYRNWVIPFIALFAVTILFVSCSLILDFHSIAFLQKTSKISLSLDYFTNNYQNAAFSIYATVALFFLVSMVSTLSSRPLVLLSSYKKVIASFFIGILVFVLSANKSNELLVFTFAPLAIMATAHIEISKPQLKEEIVLFVLMACSVFTFFSQL
ncbi:DUF6427 family protein [Flavobacterium gilvum]|uniref:Uncharacterized protein n=1 Tax=Flavobacterium gilvum TaxID=1492737 RepID=A0AAC9I397_9FLAO|nr:DUF6427 family protein [Flavobacterium gilvum]AOW08692.1 hypothetical protein EM308_03800 [Flavobacterium gilvum]KFC59877.1 hypothetical protein FEM08_13880 [Flavobacterium gilvum]